MIAVMAVEAGIAAAQVADDVGLTVSVVGTPAEEGGGGKILVSGRGLWFIYSTALGLQLLLL